MTSRTWGPRCARSPAAPASRRSARVSRYGCFIAVYSSSFFFGRNLSRFCRSARAIEVFDLHLFRGDVGEIHHGCSRDTHRDRDGLAELFLRRASLQGFLNVAFQTSLAVKRKRSRDGDEFL